MVSPVGTQGKMRAHAMLRHACTSLNALHVLTAGVQSVDVDLKEQKVVVTGDMSQEEVLETVKKTGKQTELWK